MQRPECQFDADDQKFYNACLRRTVATYGAIVLLGAGIIALQAAMNTTNIAQYAASAVADTAP